MRTANHTLLRVLALVATSSLMGCSSGHVTRGNTQLQQAIALFIDGDYEHAEEILVSITHDETISGEVLLDAFWYLGRCYMEQGQYEQAAEAFSTGVVLGGGVRFEEYLSAAQHRLDASGLSVRGKAYITRAELAALLGGRLAAIKGAPTAQSANVPPDMVGHWARDNAVFLCETGMMDVLPDGGFHPDAAVTWSSFYLVLARVGASVPSTPLSEVMPGGVRAWVQPQGRGEFVPGTDAIDIVDHLLAGAAP